MQNAHLYLLYVLYLSICESLYLSEFPTIRPFDVICYMEFLGAREHKSQCCQNGITTSDKHDTQLSIDISRLFPLCCTRPSLSLWSPKIQIWTNGWACSYLIYVKIQTTKLHPFYSVLFFGFLHWFRLDSSSCRRDSYH